MIIKETPWFAVPVGALVLLGQPPAWWRLTTRVDAEHIVLDHRSGMQALTVSPSDTIPMAVPDLVDILTMFTRAGLAPVPLAIDVSAAHLDLITKRKDGPQWLSGRHR